MALFDKLFSSNNKVIKWFKLFASVEEAEINIPINKAATVLIENKKYCFLRTNTDFRAVSDTCPHLGASLSKGITNANGDIICPWHGYRFDTKLGHETSGQGAGLGIEIYKVECKTDGIFVGI